MKKDNKKILVLLAVGVGAYFIFSSQKSAGSDDVSDIPSFGDEPPPSPHIDPTDAHIYMTPRGKEAYDYLMQYTGTNPYWAAAYANMSDVELINAWDYVWSYLLKGLKLYRTPNATGIYPDGNWNTRLYDAIDAIRKRFNIF